MVRIRAETVGSVLTRVRSVGHATKPRGAESAACAAVSVVLKSLGTVLVRSRDCDVSLTAEHPGEFDLVIYECKALQWLEGVWTLARISLNEVESTWPHEVDFELSEERG